MQNVEFLKWIKESAEEKSLILKLFDLLNEWKKCKSLTLWRLILSALVFNVSLRVRLVWRKELWSATISFLNDSLQSVESWYIFFGELIIAICLFIFCVVTFWTNGRLLSAAILTDLKLFLLASLALKKEI